MVWKIPVLHFPWSLFRPKAYSNNFSDEPEVHITNINHPNVHDRTFQTFVCEFEAYKPDSGQKKRAVKGTPILSSAEQCSHLKLKVKSIFGERVL